MAVSFIKFLRACTQCVTAPFTDCREGSCMLALEICGGQEPTSRTVSKLVTFDNDVFVLSVMDEGAGCGSSKLLLKSLQISIWWETALGGDERPHPRDFRTRGLTKTYRSVSLCGSCRARVAGAVPRAQSILWPRPQPLLGAGWQKQLWKEKLGKGICQKGWHQGGRAGELLWKT